MCNIAYKSGVNVGFGILRDIHFLKYVCAKPKIQNHISEYPILSTRPAP